jgi:hypothetical protein
MFSILTRFPLFLYFIYESVVRSKMSALSFFGPGSKCAVSKRRHAETVPAGRRYCGNCGLANPLNTHNLNQRQILSALNPSVNRPGTPQRATTIDYIDLTSPDGLSTSPTQYDETSNPDTTSTVRTVVRNAPVVPINFNAGAAPAHVVAQAPAPHRLDAPYVAAGKIHFGIGEKHRLIGREVRADPGFETRENIIIDVQVALKLPKQTDDGIVSIWKRPENGITSTQSSYA